MTFVLYQLAPDSSVLEAGEHYAAVLAKAGFKTLFTCEDVDCGPEHGPDDGVPHPYWSGQGERQITARLERRGGDVYASVHVQPESPASVRAWVTLVEASPGTGPTGSGGVAPGLSPRVEVRSTGPADPVGSGPDAIWQAEIAVTLWDAAADRPGPSGRVLLDGVDAGATGGLVRAVARRGADGRTRLPAGVVRAPGQPDRPFEIPLRPLAAKAELGRLDPVGTDVVAQFTVKAWPGAGPEPDRPPSIDGRVVVGGVEIGRLGSRLRAVAPRPPSGSPTFLPGLVSAPGYADAPFTIPLLPPSSARLPALSTRVKLVSAGSADYISLCRALDIPARFIRGYLITDELNGMVTATSHAWTEVYVGQPGLLNGWIPSECACCTPSIVTDINQNFGIESASPLRLFTDDGSNASLESSLSGISYITHDPSIAITLDSFATVTRYEEIESKKLIITKNDTRHYE